MVCGEETESCDLREKHSSKVSAAETAYMVSRLFSQGLASKAFKGQIEHGAQTLSEVTVDATAAY